jgi:phosphoesterase RecJ-like protein
VVVDHHEEPEQFADFTFWNVKAASTCELIFAMIENLGDRQLVDKTIATCLHTGLITDTGSFRFDSVSQEVHRVAGELVSEGVEVNKIHRSLFDNNDLSRLRLMGHVFSQKLVHLPEFGVAYMTISAEELKSFHSKSGDTEGIVNYGLSIKGVKVAVIFVERNDLIKISFRSIDTVSVSDFSRKYFDGGGHHNAAGGRSTIGLEKTVEKFISLLPVLIEE